MQTILEGADGLNIQSSIDREDKVTFNEWIDNIRKLRNEFFEKDETKTKLYKLINEMTTVLKESKEMLLNEGWTEEDWLIEGIDEVLNKAKQI